MPQKINWKQIETRFGFSLGLGLRGSGVQVDNARKIFFDLVKSASQKVEQAVHKHVHKDGCLNSWNCVRNFDHEIRYNSAVLLVAKQVKALDGDLCMHVKKMDHEDRWAKTDESNQGKELGHSMFILNCPVSALGHILSNMKGWNNSGCSRDKNSQDSTTNHGVNFVDDLTVLIDSSSKASARDHLNAHGDDC